MTSRDRLLAALLALAAPAAAQKAPEEPTVVLSSTVSSAAPTAPAVSSGTEDAAPIAAPPPTKALARARALYFSGDVRVAAHAFEEAVKTSSGDATAWLDGSIAWAEAGEPGKAVAWARRAAKVSGDARARAALGWALLRAARPAEAAPEFAAALKSDPEQGWAVLGAGRAALALGRTKEAVEHLKKAEGYAVQQTLADYYLGKAYEESGDADDSTEAYRRAVASDAYFHEGRDPLLRAYLRQKRYKDAWRQLSRLAEAEPSARLVRALMDKIRPLITGSAEPAPAAAGPAPVTAPGEEGETKAGIPLIRVGVATTALGRPKPRLSVTVRGSGAWHAYDPKTGRTLAQCGAQEAWTVHLVPGRVVKAKGKKRRHIPASLELRGPDGQTVAVPGDSIRLETRAPAKEVLRLEDDPNKGGPLAAGRSLRGAIEVTLFHHGRTLRLVNVLDLEDYTQGVVGAEMPSNSPLEALKTQALIARTHVMFIKTVSRRHRREGYDVCDEQHCQVYAGLRMENERTRAAVAATRGKVLRYQGRIAHAIYSSNCGGATQSGKDIGWGNVPYWVRESDSPVPEPLPASPLELRRVLSTWPQTFDKPSGYVHASHSRWVRVISAKDLSERLNRRHRVGTVKGLRVLRRAPTGHVEAVLVLGSRRNLKLDDEYEIRALLGAGSLRSTLFVVDTEYRSETAHHKAAKGKKAPKPETVLVPESFVFRGGGWGHAVGLCQSGAIGRAEAGEDYQTIVKSYFPGVSVDDLGY